MIYVFIFAASMVLSAVLSRVVRDAANAHGWVTEPSSPRHVHRGAMPRLGGIAILASVIAVVSLTSLVLHLTHMQSGVPGMTFVGLLGPTLMIFALGLADDFRSISPYVKFGVQILAAVVLFLDGFRITRFQVIFGERELGTFLGLILTVFWILLITNAFNLLDGLDGLAAGSALFSCIVVFVVSLVSGNALTQIVSAALAGAVVGFLRYNFKPATIFLGDCGSLVIGFLLGAVSLASSQKASIAVAVGIPVVSFGLPILDTALAILRRFLNGRPLFSADGEHIHHKLLQRGLSQRQVVIVLYGVSAVLALFSLFFLYPHSVGAVLAIVGLGVFFGLQHIGYHEVDELYRVARRTWEQKSIISNNLAIRRATEEMSKARGFQDVCEILRIAFRNNDFDGFGFSFSGTRLATNGEGRLEMPLEYWWNRQGAGRDRGWALQLDLVSADGERRGFFSVFRNYSHRALRSDINCLNREFARALSAALERVQEFGVEPLHESAGMTGLEQERLAG
jgi:UDP-GlcNAc:undecaprenyl-phosphate/decaprenyl-phosphate GlcNAc-1-phosphate transferase